MRYLLDTHAFIWFSENDPLLSRKAAKQIEDVNNTCYLSIASLWEIAIKCSNGKLEINTPFAKIESFLQKNYIQILPVELDDLYSLMILPLFHRDPFDRIIIAQGIADDLTILTTDKLFQHYPVACLW